MELAQEVVNITEGRDGAQVFIEELGLSEDEAAEMVSALFTLSFDHLTRDLKKASGSIPISKDPAMDDCVTSVSMLLVEGDFQLLVYFGGQADPDTSLRDGLLHVAEVLATVREELFE